MRQYYVDCEGLPVLTTDGEPVHSQFDAQGQVVVDPDDGLPVLVAVEVPPGSRVVK
jgi:hypothetical protein